MDDIIISSTVIMKFCSTVPADVCKEQSKFELTRGQQIFKNIIYEPFPNSRRPKCDIKQVPCRLPKILEWSANLNVIWRFQLAEFDVVHIFVGNGESSKIILSIVRILVQNSVAGSNRHPGCVHFGNILIAKLQ
jgi:hypothetical protein